MTIDDWQLELQTALDLASSDVDGTCDRLERLTRECPYSEIRRRSRDRLDILDRARRARAAREKTQLDPDVDLARSKWSNVTGAADGRARKVLETYIDDQGQQHVFVSVCREIVDDLDRWLIKDAERMTGGGVAGAEDGRVAGLIDFIKLRPALADGLGDALRRWDTARFNVKYASRIELFRQAVEQWDLSVARDVYRQLESECPQSAQSQMDELRKQLMSLEGDRAVVEAVVSEGNGLLEGHPDTTFDAAGYTFDCTVAVLKCRRCTMAGGSAVPAVFKQKLDAVADGIAKQMTDMWEHLASGSSDPGGIDQLLRAYRSARKRVDLVWIPGESSDDEARKLQDVLAELLPEPPVWENAAMGSLRSHVAESIRAATSPDALDGILATLDLLPMDLSEDFRPAVLQMQATTIAIREAWRTMRLGESFTSVDDFEWRPEGFGREESAEPGFRGLLDRLAGVRVRFQDLRADLDPDADPMRARNEVADLIAEIEAVLALWSPHAQARALRVELEGADWLIQLDRALRSWNVDQFDSLFRSLPVSVAGLEQLGSYRAIHDHSTDMRLLAEQFGTLPTLPEATGMTTASDRITRQIGACRDLAGWTTTWIHTSKRLFAVVPPLPRALEIAIEAGRVESLKRLTLCACSLTYGCELSPDDADTVCSILESFTGDGELAAYIDKLQRMATIGRVGHLLDQGEWQAALEALASLGAPSTPSFRGSDELLVLYLRAKLQQFGGPADGDVVARAGLLADEWPNLVRLIDSPVRILAETAMQAWDSLQWDALRRLKGAFWAAEGSSAADDPGARADLRTWLALLDLLDMPSFPQPTIETLKVLVDRFDIRGKDELSLTDTQHHLLVGLVQQWQAGGDRVLLAWVYRAFSRLQPSVLKGMVDPLVELSRKARIEADAIGRELSGIDDPESEAFVALIQRLDAAKQSWRRLGAMPMVVPGFLRGDIAVPDSLDRIGRTIESIQTTRASLDKLDDADLRVPLHGAELSAVHRDLFSLDVHYRSPVDALKIHLSRLEALEESARYLMAVVPEQAMACGSIDDAPKDPFPPLIETLRRLIGVFEDQRLEGRGMWSVVSAECWRLTRDEGGLIMLGDPPTGDLRQVFDEAVACLADEAVFAAVIVDLFQRARSESFPPEGFVDCGRVQDWMERIPREPPRSRRVRGQFARFMRHQFLRGVFAKCLDLTPLWTRDLWNETGSP